MVIVLLMCLSLAGLGAQDSIKSMSLKECLAYTMEHSAVVQKSKWELEKARYKTKELVSAGLPKVNLSAAIQYHFDLPVQIASGEAFAAQDGTVPLEFGKKLQTSLGLEFSQIVYSKNFSIGKEGTNKLIALQQLVLEKSKEEAAFEIAKLYYQGLIVAEKRNLLQANLDQIGALLKLTALQYENGFAKKIDVARLSVAKMNIETKLKNISLQYDQLLQVLKYHMAMPLDEKIVLSDTISGQNYQLSEISALKPDFSQKTELSLLNIQGDLYQINVKRLKAGAYPSIFLLGEYNISGWGDNFSQLGSGDYWYKESLLGLRLHMPLFDGYRRKAQLSQAQAQIELWKEDRRFTELSLQLQHNSSMQKLKLNVNNLQSLRENRQLAEEVYRISRERFSEGVAPIMELLSAETAMREAQTNYLSALLEVQMAELELKNARGELLNMIE